MSYNTYYGPKTNVSESCIWIKDGYRRICMTYNYNTASGNLRYAASVFRCEYIVSSGQTFHIEPTEKQMTDNSHTTERRFNIRPVCIIVEPELSYNNIISTIRHEMCHGYGCKGPRGLSFDNQEFSDENSEHGSESSATSFLSESEPLSLNNYRASLYNSSLPGWSDMCKDNVIPVGSQLKMNYHGKSNSCTVTNNIGKVIDNFSGTVYDSLNKWALSIRNSSVNVFDVCCIMNRLENIDEVEISSIMTKKTRKIRYISNETTENYNGKNMSITREFFVAFKADKLTGDLIYGAAISRLPAELGPMTDVSMIDGHFETAIARLEKKPVVMRLSKEFLHQISSKASHREDVMYEIMDNITKRKDGNFIIKSI